MNSMSELNPQDPSFSNIFQNHWKRGKDFILTVNAHSSDYQVWTSLGLKMAAKNSVWADVSAHTLDPEELFANLPQWIQAGVERQESSSSFREQDVSHLCVVVLFKTGFSRAHLLTLLSWAILKNSDVHILDSGMESQSFLDRLAQHPECVQQDENQQLRWVFFPAQIFNEEFLVKQGNEE